MSSTGGSQSTAAVAVVELNVGGAIFATTLDTLRAEPDSRLARWFGDPDRHLARDSAGRYFIDRDGQTFGRLLNYLRSCGGGDRPPAAVCLTAGGSGGCDSGVRAQLKAEAAYYGLSGALAAMDGGGGGAGSACITVGYRGTFAFGRDGLADVKFRKLTRILVAGRISLCRQVFGDTLNESRDPDRGEDDRYTSRFFLKHNILEQAFEMLYDAGFLMAGSCGSGTNSSMTDVKPGQDNEETKWQHYNEFVFVKT